MTLAKSCIFSSMQKKKKVCVPSLVRLQGVEGKYTGSDFTVGASPHKGCLKGQPSHNIHVCNSYELH